MWECKEEYKASVWAFKIRALQKSYKCFTNRLPEKFGRN